MLTTAFLYSIDDESAHSTSDQPQIKGVMGPDALMKQMH